LTVAELVKDRDVDMSQVADWKERLMDAAGDVFDKGAQK
tara:strand:+ start:59 stop:175 length:117 start_codon:yes stop_codon:yes gene_type:complete